MKVFLKAEVSCLCLELLVLLATPRGVLNFQVTKDECRDRHFQMKGELTTRFTREKSVLYTKLIKPVTRCVVRALEQRHLQCLRVYKLRDGKSLMLGPTSVRQTEVTGSTIQGSFALGNSGASGAMAQISADRNIQTRCSSAQG